MKTQHLIAFKTFYLAVGIIGLFIPSWWILFFWIIFAIGNGTVGHRYFSHENFRVSAFTHWLLAIWCTISSYSPPIYWQVQHRHHHRHTDSNDDIHAPGNGIFMSFIGWTFSKSRIDSIFKDKACIYNQIRGQKDTAIRMASEYFISINLIFLLCLLLIDWTLALSAAVASLLEHLRLGLVNSLCHIQKIPGNYRNHETTDGSQNNLLLGWIGLGFGWHNNHHHDPKKLVLTEKWWEIDLEGQIGRLLSKL